MNHKKRTFLAIASITTLASSMALANSTLTGDISAQSNQLASGVGGNEGNRYLFSADIKYSASRPGDLERNIELAVLRNDAHTTMYSLKEAYVGHRFGNTFFQIGRENLDWSILDQRWGFGKINNRVNFNGFTPGQEGLAGLFLSHQFDSGINFSVFGSPLYVPEMNPAMDINNDTGTITSGNPWAKVPNQTADLNGQKIPIKYRVEYPDVGEIVLRKSFGATLGFKSKYFDFQTFAIRKPENQLSQSVEITYSNGDKAVQARVKPQVFYHTVLGATSTLKYKNVGLYGSTISIRPETIADTNALVTQYTAIETQKRREDYMGAGAYFHSDKFSIDVGYIARISRFDLIGDMLAQVPRWNQAINLSVSSHVTNRLTLSADIKYDTLTKDRLYMADASLGLSRGMYASVGVYIIGAANNGRSYWYDYRNNDAVYGSLKYRF